MYFTEIYSFFSRYLLSFFISLQNVGDRYTLPCTFIFRSLRLCVGILLWFDVCWRYAG